jgi:hypothetical protein
MKERTVIERIGEYLGPIDWTYDFTQHNWGSNRGGINPDIVTPAMEMLRQIESPGRWRVMMYQNYHEVLRVGMYDGWPFWKPTPSVLVSGALGAEWHPFYNIQAVERVPEQRPVGGE